MYFKCQESDNRTLSKMTVEEVINFSANGAQGADGDFDHNLYSRQLYTLGESAMKNLRMASVLISGIGSVGVEIAKNLILGGIRNVTIHDTKQCQWIDLSAQYYLREEDIGHNRATASFERLAELNDSVTCAINTDILTENFVKQFDLVVLTDAPLSTQLKVNAWTRAHNRRFLVADARGLFGVIFLDLGQDFVINDLNGEQCKEVFIEHVDAETGDVMTLEGVFHGFEDGDHVVFSEVKGMTELNNALPIKISVKKPNIFNIGSAAASFSPYEEGGRAAQVKTPTHVTYKSLEESITNPDILIWDYAKFEHPNQLHSMWQALQDFQVKYSRLPQPRSDEDVELMRGLIKEEDIDEKLLRAFCYQASGNLVTMCSVVGGIAAQEAMKAVTHHMTPLKQFLYIDCLEALPGDWSPFDNSKLMVQDCAPQGTRYDGQVAVFGRAYQDALMRQKFFIVGAAATTTPTPTKVLYPTDVTIAQRQYAQGFLDALASVQKLNGFVPAPGLLNSPSFLTPLLPSVTTTCDPSKTVSSPILTSPTREPLSVIMQAMSGMGGFAGYGLPQLYNPMSQAPPPPQQMMVPSTSSLPVSTITSCLPPQPLPPQPTSQHQVVVPRSVKNEMASSVSDESKESSYDMYNPAESTNDGEACSSTRSNGSPMSQDELGMSSFSGFSEYNLSDQERKKLERKRARNRTAATKCRQRKLMKISELERVVNEEKQTGTRLSHELKMLEASIAQLRQTLHEHRNRGCVIPTK